MWAFSNTNPKPFAPQQVWASSFVIGLILFFFTAFQGMGAHVLGGNPLVNDAGIAGLPIVNVLDGAAVAAQPDSLVPRYFNQIADTMPWLVGLLAVCALAAMQSTGAAYMSTAGGMLTRDLYKRYLNPAADHATQKLFGRMGVAFIVISALLVATFSSDALVLLGGLAVAFGFQMWPALAGICWFPWITRQGATLGLAAGLLGVIFTEGFGHSLVGLFGIDLPWGRWPWTIHSAGWGIIFNLAVCIPVSAATQTQGARAHRMRYHDFLREHASLPQSKRGLIPVAWAITLAWMFFGIGPGAVIGNDIFGAPGAGVEGWTFGIPSIWAWQILFWILGVAMMWFLAYRMEMSTVPEHDVEALVEDIGDMAPSRQRG
jgi:Na+/proline symporter